MTSVAGPRAVGAPFDFLDARSFRDGIPYDRLAELRAECPLTWVDDGDDGGYWVALGHGEVVEISRNPAVFSSYAMSCFPKDPRPAELPEVRQMLLNMDPPQHTRFRLIVNRVFTPRTIRNITAGIDAHARDVVASLPDSGTFDFVRSVGVEMSLRVLADVMGLSQSDRPLLYDWTERLVGDGDTELGGDPRAFMAALMEMFQYADEQTEAKRRNPTDDVWSLIANAEVEGERLTKEELNRFFQLLATAGNETTRTLISAGFVTLSEHPDQLEWIRSGSDGGPDLDVRIERAVEEMLRFVPPVMQFRRTATEPTQIAGRQIAAGEKVLLFYPAANRDPRVFDEPDRFDVSRENNPHLAFGVGPHFCLGANLARVEARSLFRELLTRRPDLRPCGSPTRLQSMLINGYREIPVA